MTVTAIDRMFEGLANGDVDMARSACTLGALLWHNYDGLALTLDEIVPQWAGLIANTKERFVTDIRRQPTASGFVQQHLFVMRTMAGERKAWPVCIVVRTEGDLIARLDEYIGRSDSFAASGDPARTPGF